MGEKAAPKRKLSLESKVSLVEKNLNEGVSTGLLALEHGLSPRLVRERYKFILCMGLKLSLKENPQGHLETGGCERIFNPK